MVWFLLIHLIRESLDHNSVYIGPIELRVAIKTPVLRMNNIRIHLSRRFKFYLLIERMRHYVTALKFT